MKTLESPLPTMASWPPWRLCCAETLLGAVCRQRPRFLLPTPRVDHANRRSQRGQISDAAATSVLPEHTCGTGNLGKFQENCATLRALVCFGVQTCAGPFCFPSEGTTETAKLVDVSRFLECANGGTFEWGTGGEEKARRQSRKRQENDGAACCRRCCLGRQASTFACFSSLASSGLGGRVLSMHTPAASLCLVTPGRAVVDRNLGRQPQERISAELRQIWTNTANLWGRTSCPASSIFRPNAAAQRAVDDLCYNVRAVPLKLR